MPAEFCPALHHCIGCNEGYECVDLATIQAWEPEHGKFDWSKASAAYVDVAPGEKGPIEWRIGYTLNRRDPNQPRRISAVPNPPKDWCNQ